MIDLLRVSNLKKYFPVKRSLREILRFEKEHNVKAVDGVSFTVQNGKVFVLAGESGSGKTTVARLILRAIDPDSGSIIFDGDDITKRRETELRKVRTSIQMVYQDPYTSLNPRMKILDIIMEPLNINDKHSSKVEKKRKSFANIGGCAAKTCRRNIRKISTHAIRRSETKSSTGKSYSPNT